MDSFIRRALLKPIAKRKGCAVKRDTINAVLDSLDSRAIAGSYLPELAKMHKEMREQRTKDSWKDPHTAAITIALANAMFLARKISVQEYTFMTAIAAEDVHDGRISDDGYPEVVELMTKIRAIEVAAGLGPEEYWAIGEGPAEYQTLNLEYEVAIDKRFTETLRELGANDIADLYLQDNKEFDRRRERGRRAFFHKDEMMCALTDTVVRYEMEARKAALAGAHTAAIILLGAAVEGLLILRCLRSPIKAQRIAASLPRAKRPRPADSPTHWRFDTLIETCLAAGWLPETSTDIATILPGGLAHSLRQMRNYIHPGKVAEHRPWIDADEIEYATAEAIFTTVLSTVSGAKRLQLFREVAQSPHTP